MARRLSPVAAEPCPVAFTARRQLADAEARLPAMFLVKPSRTDLSPVVKDSQGAITMIYDWFRISRRGARLRP